VQFNVLIISVYFLRNAWCKIPPFSV